MLPFNFAKVTDKMFTNYLIGYTSAFIQYIFWYEFTYILIFDYNTMIHFLM